MKADFNFIRYANVWEDPRVLLKAIYTKPGSRYLSVASAGDNVFALLTLDPESIVAVDVSPVQLFLLEFKMAAISELDREEVLGFLGFSSCANRLDLFQKMKHRMSVEAREYFEQNASVWSSKGIVHEGKFEKYFLYFSKYILPLIHSRKTIQRLLSIKSLSEQQEFFKTTWNSWRWRTLFKVFFSKWVMGRLGRDPEFLKHVQVPVSEFILAQSERQLTSLNAQTNPFLRYNLTGSFGEMLPFYLQEEHFEVIKNGLARIVLHRGFAQDAIEEYGQFDGMNLSNIFEYMPQELFQETAQKLISGLSESGKMVYWNLMVRRRCSELSQGNNLIEKYSQMMELRDTDWGYFYDSVVVDEKVQIHEFPIDNDTFAVRKFEDSSKLASLTAYINQQIEGGNTVVFGDYFCDIMHLKAGELVLQYAIQWAQNQGFSFIIGPMNGSTWDSYRFKVNGRRNFLGDLKLNSKYAQQWETQGFEIFSKYQSTQVRYSEKESERYFQRKMQLEKAGVVFRNIDMSRWEEELKRIYLLSLQSFKHNFLYSDIAWKAFLNQYQLLKSSLDPKWILLAENGLNQELIGFLFAYPDLHSRSEQPTLIVKTVARQESYRWSGLGLVMTHIVQQQANEHGIHHFIHAFMHEDAVSSNCSDSMKAAVIAEYVLLRKKL
jgi:S-adenosylmethionine-diacylglycerol 3-amino-3-carboxypropyl transferase